MDPSKIAVSVPVTDVTGVTNDLREGSRVNVYAAGVDSVGTSLLFQNMRILAVAHDSSGALTSATIEVDARESLELIYAATYSSVYLGLVDGSGYEYTEEQTPGYAPGDEG